MGCHSFLQEIFLTQGLNPILLHCRRILYHLIFSKISQFFAALAAAKACVFADKWFPGFLCIDVFLPKLHPQSLLLSKHLDSFLLRIHLLEQYNRNIFTFWFMIYFNSSFFFFHTGMKAVERHTTDPHCIFHNFLLAYFWHISGACLQPEK